MTYSDLIRSEISSLPVYQPGQPIELLAREYGIEPSTIIKLASNENPLGPPPGALEAMRDNLSGTALYPDNSGYELVGAICERHGFKREQITLAAGSNEIFYRLADLFAEPGTEVVLGEYAFISYRIAAMLAGATVVSVPMPGLVHDLGRMREAVTERTRLVFLPNPNNPTGTGVPVEEVAAFARSLPEWVVFCYDEAYAEYETERLDVRALIEEGVNVIGTRTFSKVYGLAGLRIGYGYSDSSLAELLNRVRPPFNTSSLSQVAAVAALADTDWIARSRRVNESGRRQLETGLAGLGLKVCGDRGNFVLFSLANAASIAQGLQEMGIIVRPLAGYGLPDYLRVSIGTEAQNDRFLEGLSTLLKRV
ncbi:MAG: histidinol-phosphate transaminase [Oceanipulchritudo sp.]